MGKVFASGNPKFEVVPKKVAPRRCKSSLRFIFCRGSGSSAANQERVKQLQKWCETDRVVFHITKFDLVKHKVFPRIQLLRGFKKDVFLLQNEALKEIFNGYRRHIGQSNIKIRASASLSIQRTSVRDTAHLPTKAPVIQRLGFLIQCN